MYQANRTFMSILAALIMSLVFCGGANAEQDKLLNQGLLVDETFTHKGNLFFQSFALAWHQHNPKVSGNVAISEKPNARYGHQVFISFNNQIVYQGVIRSGNMDYAQLAENAVQNSAYTIRSMMLQRFAGNSPDLGRDEI